MSKGHFLLSLRVLLFGRGTTVQRCSGTGNLFSFCISEIFFKISPSTYVDSWAPPPAAGSRGSGLGWRRRCIFTLYQWIWGSLGIKEACSAPGRGAIQSSLQSLLGGNLRSQPFLLTILRMLQMLLDHQAPDLSKYLGNGPGLYPTELRPVFTILSSHLEMALPSAVRWILPKH